MNTVEINNLIKCFGGKCISLDQLPQSRIDAPAYYCVNTDFADVGGGGTHWLGLALLENNGRRIIYYLDSLGICPSLKNVLKFINVNVDNEKPTLICNKNALQHDTSDLCGGYVILFLIYMHQKRDFNDYCKEFSASPLVNDEKMRTIMKKMMRGGEKSKTGQSCKALKSLAS